MNQSVQTTKWQGDCLITVQGEERTLFLNFQDLRQKKQKDLRALVPGHEQNVNLTWIHVMSSTTEAINQHFGEGWIDSIGQGQDHTFWIKPATDVSADKLARRVKDFLEEHADIAVHTN